MTPVPPPRPSPEIPHDEPAPTTTGIWKLSLSNAFETRIQWGVIGTLGLALCTFLLWGINKLDVVNTAQAQTQATAATAVESGKTNSARIEAVDSGTRQAIENLRKEISDDRDNTDKKLTDMQLTLQAVLREVKKK